jgi:hypothetical protein
VPLTAMNCLVLYYTTATEHDDEGPERLTTPETMI